MGMTHNFGSYNVEGSINEFFRTNITAAGLPSWMPSARMVFNYPEQPLISGYSGHAFSVTHVGSVIVERFQGRGVDSGLGHKRRGTLDFSCWVSKQAAGRDYALRLAHMRDMAMYMTVSAREVTLRNILSSTSTPPTLTAIARLEPIEWLEPMLPDAANPDLIRARGLVRYDWIERF